MKSYKVAVCLSGQPRYWKQCVDSIKQHFESRTITYDGREIEVDYFIHTWDTNTWKHQTQKTACTLEKIDDIDCLKSELELAFSPKVIEIESENDVFNNGIDYAWKSLFYSFMKSVFQKRNYELENNFEYDCVIKTRLDLIFNPVCPFSYNRLMPLVAYVGHMSKFPAEFNSNNFDDIMFYADSGTMDLVSEIYFAHEQLMKEFKDPYRDPFDINMLYWLGPGCLLYEHISKLRIHPVVKLGMDYAIMRTSMVEKNLNVETDFPELKKLFFEWYK